MVTLYFEGADSQEVISVFLSWRGDQCKNGVRWLLKNVMTVPQPCRKMGKVVGYYDLKQRRLKGTVNLQLLVAPGGDL